MDSTIRFWDINTGDKSRQVKALAKCYDMHVSRSETNFVTGHQDRIKFWNAKSRESVFTLNDVHSQPVSCVRFTQDECYVASISKDSCLKIWDIRKRELLHTFEDSKFKIASNNIKLCISPNS